ncbi:unnamed protein product [Brachionus calyciflorus]|uniref:TIR domain-containing protein n=1 Tax=Brachionus calyciflorus TaxID=104777 RepID=A0A814G2V3_9BILA|nr:unnamed protein product [Brachionus calyciflorus]
MYVLELLFKYIEVRTTDSVSRDFIGTTSTTTTTTTVTTRTTTTSTTTTTTKQPTTTSSTTTITSTTTTSTTTQTVNINSIGQLLNSNSTSSTTTTQNDNLYFLLLLLLIPLILLLVLLFLCCCGRWFSVCCFGCCSTRLCQCAQPDKKTIFKDDAEINDISILYNENNQMWVDKNFVPNLRNAKRDLKINKINKPSDLTPDNKTQISNSRRIALIFTKKFIQNEWQNQELKNFLKEINPERIIIAICVGDLTRKQIKQYLRQIESDHVKKNIFTRFANCAKSRIKYNTSLNNLEIVDYHSTEFWNRFNYILPIDRVEGPDGIIDESKYNKIKEEASEKGAVKPERSQSSISVENEVPLLNKLKKSIEANRVSPENTPRQVQDNLIINMDDFWTPYMAKSPGDYNYEPVAVAGTPNKGNKESNLKRFGVNLPPVNDKNLGSKKLQKITSNLREEGKEDMNDKSGRIQVPNALINNFIERTKEPALKETDNPEKNNFKLNKKSSLRDPPKIESESGSNDRDEEEKKLPKLKKKVVIETELNSLAHYPIHLNENSNDESVDKKKKKRKSKKKSSNNDDDDDNSKSNDQ